jgi:hypothetical protein
MDQPHDGPEPIDPHDAYIASLDRPVAVCVDGKMVWTEADKESPAVALSRYFAALPPPEPAEPEVMEVGKVRFTRVAGDVWSMGVIGSDLTMEVRLEPMPAIKRADPNAKPALAGLTRTACSPRKGPGWCDE